MQEEHTLVEIYHRDSGTGLVVGSHIGQLVVVAKRLACMTRPHSTSEIYLLAINVLPNAVDSLNIS